MNKKCKKAGLRPKIGPVLGVGGTGPLSTAFGGKYIPTGKIANTNSRRKLWHMYPYKTRVSSR